MKKRYLIPLLFLGVLLVGFLAGPKPDYPEFTSKIEPLDLAFENVASFVSQKHKNTKNLKPNNASYLVWADSIPQKTKYSIVYLHGFSASPKEGDPIHEELAERYACNLYVPLLAGHGIDDKESFKNITPKDWIDSAKEAIAIGNIIGEKVIVMSCSTGGTLSAFLTAENPDLIDAQMTYSPNIDLANDASELFTLPWGLPLLQQVMGSKYRQVNLPPSCAPYWTMEYRLEGLIALKSLIESTMSEETFAKIEQPLFVGYYFKNEEKQDQTISTAAIRNYVANVNTPADQKVEKAFAEGKHVLLSDLQMPDEDLAKVREETFKFVENVLELQPQEF